tara:strand:- start:154 stop:621 length:468 start_codon:yes stop_codon:yes gene_type:complete
MFEIERKFLVNSDNFKRQASITHQIVQGYLSTDPGRSVRVRIQGEKAYLTIKGAAVKNSLSRFEWEREISLEDAEVLMPLCLPKTIQKTRHYVEFCGHLFEVDVFEGENSGLTVAEIELKNELEDFEKPKWLGKEITGIKKYYNAQLSQKPFAEW